MLSNFLLSPLHYEDENAVSLLVLLLSFLSVSSCLSQFISYEDENLPFVTFSSPHLFIFIHLSVSHAHVISGSSDKNVIDNATSLYPRKRKVITRRKVKQSKQKNRTQRNRERGQHKARRNHQHTRKDADEHAKGYKRRRTK